MKRVLVFVNTAARQGQSCLEQVHNWLKENSFIIVNPDYDGRRDDLGQMILDYKDKADVVIIGGGDGSVNHALPALLETQLPLLVLPLGTANNLARTLGLSKNFTEVLELLKENHIQMLDVGFANGIPFMNVVGMGLSTQVNRVVRSGLKRWIGAFAFIYTAFIVALRMTPFKVRIECDGRTLTSRTWQITVCNGRNYGSGLTIHETATLSDSRLHGLSTEVEKWWHAFKLIPALLTGRYKRDHEVKLFDGETIRLVTKKPMRVDVDGDIKTQTPVEITVKPEALKVLTPVSRKTVNDSNESANDRSSLKASLGSPISQPAM